jgi:hypothetical protein
MLILTHSWHSAVRLWSAKGMLIATLTGHLAVVQKAFRLPVVLSYDEVTRLLEATSEVKYKAAFASPMAPGCAWPR